MLPFPMLDCLVFPMIPIYLHTLERDGYVRGMWAGDSYYNKSYLQCALVLFDPMYTRCDGGPDNVVDITFEYNNQPGPGSITRRYVVVSPVGNAYPFPDKQEVGDSVIKLLNEQLEGTYYRCSFIRYTYCRFYRNGGLKRYTVEFKPAVTEVTKRDRPPTQIKPPRSSRHHAR